MTKQKFPRGWDQARVQAVLDHYENQTDEEAAAEDEAAYHAEGYTMMAVPHALLPAVRALIARHQVKAKKVQRPHRKPAVARSTKARKR